MKFSGAILFLAASVVSADRIRGASVVSEDRIRGLAPKTGSNKVGQTRGSTCTHTDTITNEGGCNAADLSSERFCGCKWCEFRDDGVVAKQHQCKPQYFVEVFGDCTDPADLVIDPCPVLP